MKIIDTRTGKEMFVGKLFHYPEVIYDMRTGRKTLRDRYVIIDQIEEGLFSAQARVRISEGRPPDQLPMQGWGSHHYVPLIVRYTHPDFFLQKVAFFPS
jgi:hypothetical protein